jgi:gamma-glutamylaminecyclotransferase
MYSGGEAPPSTHLAPRAPAEDNEGSMPAGSSRPLFVYGTLMAGETHCVQMEGARLIGAAVTEAAYTLLDLGPYPGLVPGGSTAVAGELYQVAPAALRRLDAFEEHPEVYRRAPVRLAEGGRALAYLLVRPPAGARVIAAGDWRRR